MEPKTFPTILDQNIENRQLVHDLRNALSPILLYAQILEASLSKLSLENDAQTAHLISDLVKEIDEMIVNRLGCTETV